MVSALPKNRDQVGPCPTDGMDSTNSRTHPIQGVHPLAESRLAVLPPVEPVRAATQGATAEHFERHRQWQADRYSDDKGRRESAGGKAPLGLNIPTPGAGKTTSVLTESAGSDLPTVYIGDRREDADAASIRQPLIFRRRAHENAPGERNHCARTAADDGVLGWRSDGTPILMHPDWSNSINGALLIRELADHGQTVGGNLCPTCPKGMLRALNNPTSRYTPYQKKRMQEFLNQHYDEKEQAGILGSECWLDENAEATKALHISITSAGLGASDSEYHGEEDNRHRGLAVDETRPGVMGETIPLSFADIGQALDDIRDHRVRAANEKGDLIFRLPNVKTEKGEDAMRQRIEELEDDLQFSRHVETVYHKLHEELARLQDVSAKEAIDVPNAMVDAIREFRDATVRRHLAPHEKPSWETPAKIRRVPHRLIEIIATSIERGSACVYQGVLRVVYTSPLFEIIERGDHPVLATDATPDPKLLEIMRAKGATITDLKAHQNVVYYYDHRRYRGTGVRHRSDGSIIERSAEMQMAEARRKVREHQHTLSIVQRNHPESAGQEWVSHGNRQDMIPLLSTITGTDLAKLEKMPEQDLRNLVDVYRVGWYGLHDRAHDKWTSLHLDIWGDPSIPDGAKALAYMDHRALCIHAGLPAQPHYRDEWLPAREHRVEMNGHDVEVPRRVHAVPEIRDFMQMLKDNVELQTIGRLRGVNADRPLIVAKHGGTPNAALDAHGIPSYPALLDPSPTDRDRKEQEHQDAMTGIDGYMRELVRDGKGVTRENLNQLQRERGEPQTAPATYQKWLASPNALSFSAYMAKTGRGSRYAKALDRAVYRAPAGTTEMEIGQRIEEIRQAQHSKGGCVTDADVLRGMLQDARALCAADEPNAIDQLAAEIITTVLTGDGGIYSTTPPAIAPPAAA